jgi:nucleotide-binding universal stress UspA family protein
MTISLYLPLRTYPDPIEEGILPVVVDVARHIRASITGAGVEVDIPPVKNKLAEAILHLQEQIRAVEQTSRANCERLLKELVRLGASSDVPIACELLRAQPALIDDALVQAARFHDFTVLPMPLNEPAAQGTGEALVFGSGRPVLLLPGVDSGQLALDTVVIATDFGRVAARAMFDAQPFVQRAARVHVVTVTGEKDVSHGNRAALASHFARRGLSPQLVQLDAKGEPVASVLQKYCDQQGGALLVMGAFGHSRLRDFVLGGATRTILAEARHPVLMSY